ncbi:MAG TPA: phospholipid carrier-dependent glycosyltransferase [Actinomycetales bacterium]|nr:phospholipid carrier-dependent glycosyltransferase [Actinomycetales bacterium]
MTTTAVSELRPAVGQRTETTRLRRQLLGRRPDEVLWGWLGPLIITAVGGFFRFWQLGRPHQLVFDETYYVKQGSSFLDYGFEKSVAPSLGTTPDKLFTAGTTDVWANAPDFVVHPPVGKWMIALGELLFGQTSSFGWRFASAVCGTLSILMLARVARRLFGSTLLGCVAGLLIAFDGHHFVHSRTGLLDIFVMFWALAAFACLLIDRDRARERLAVALGRASGAHSDHAPGAPPYLASAATTRLGGFGVRLGLRPWRIAAGVCLGLCTGTKWSGLYFIAVFGVMTFLWDVGMRRAVGNRTWVRAGLLDGFKAFVSIAPVALGVYLVSWSGWFATKGGWDREWGAQHPSQHWGVVPDALRGLWHYHAEMYRFHVGLHSPHPYKTEPWSWIVQGRPTSFFYEGPTKGHDGCTVAQCSKAITSIGTPTLWWGAAVAIVILVVMWALRRDWRAGAVLSGVLAGYVPWFAFEGRTIYSFYAIAFVPWMVLAVTYVIGMALGRPGQSLRRRMAGVVLSGAFVISCVWLFFFFWPIYTAQVIPYSEWAARMWFPSWI